MTARRSLRTLAATLLVAAGVALLPQAPASAAACAGASGVTVVVDPNELGGGISAGCDGDGGSGDVAAKYFKDAGYTIEFTQASGMGSGFVCKVNGRPADGDCTQTNAYWSLWWSDGKTGKWAYANRGVNSLHVPSGGYVAFSWHAGGGQATAPDVVPTPRAAAPKPTPTPSDPVKKPKKPNPSAKATPTKPSPSASASASPSASATSSATPPETASPTAPSSTATSGAAPTDTSSSDLPSIDEITDGPEASAPVNGDGDDDGGLPLWLGAGLVVIILGGAAAIPILRRRQG